MLQLSSAVCIPFSIGIVTVLVWDAALHRAWCCILHPFDPVDSDPVDSDPVA